MKKTVFTIVIAVMLPIIVYSAWVVENLGSPPNYNDDDFQCSINNAGNTIFFVTPNPVYKIHVSEKSGNSWEIPIVLPNKINNPGAEYPFWDDTNNRLFFVGDDGGSAGIFYSDYLGGPWENNASWTTPTSVGSDVNTPGNNERSPVVTGGYLYFERNFDIWVADWNGSTATNDRLTGIGSGAPGDYYNGKLYFTSDRAGGEGYHDVWYAEGSGNSFSSAVNMTEVNTSDDDVHPSWADNIDHLFLASKYDYPDNQGGFDLCEAYDNSSIQSTSLGVIKSLFE